MIVAPIQTDLFREGDDLVAFIKRHMQHLVEGDIVVIASKIAALAEQRTVPVPSAQGFEELIQTESDHAIPTKHVWLTIKDGIIMPSAGIDTSNADGKLILLPKDCFHAAHTVRTALCAVFGVQKLGVIITDSQTIPLRAGVIGLALGYAGFCGIRDYRGTQDLYGRAFTYSCVDVADSLATAATLVMGEGDERQPLAIIRDAPVTFCEHVDRTEMCMDSEADMYEPLLKHFKQSTS